MRKRKIWKALVALALIATMLCGSAMAASMGAKAFSATMPVYRSNSTSNRIGALKRGTAFTVTAISGGWARISYKGRTGYAQLKDIMFDNPIKAVSTKASGIRFITKNSIKKNIYYTATLAAGVPLNVVGVNGDYLLFLNQDGSALGYVSRSAVRKL